MYINIVKATHVGGIGESGQIMLTSRSSHSGASTARGEGWRQQLASIGNYPKVRRTDYEVVKRCGLGSYSHVVAAVEKDTGKKVAIKVFKQWQRSGGWGSGIGENFGAGTPPETQTLVNSLSVELEFLQKIGSHPHIVPVKAVCIDCAAFVMEAGKIDLYQLIRTRYTEINMDMIWAWTGQIASALVACHEKFIIHLDLKTSNVLIMGDLTAKVCDFGNATYTRRNGRLDSQMECVTLWYRAPELLMGAVSVDNKVDMWALGVCLLEMLNGAPPFPGTDMTQNLAHPNYNHDQLDRIFRSVGTPQDMLQYSLMPCFELFRYAPHHKSMLSQYVNQSIQTHKSWGGRARKAAEARSPHVWYSLLKSLLELSPERRPTAKQTLEILSMGPYGISVPKPSRDVVASPSKRGLFAKLPFMGCTW